MFGRRLTVGDDVVVGDDAAVVVPDEAGAGAGLLFERPVVPAGAPDLDDVHVDHARA